MNVCVHYIADSNKVLNLTIKDVENRHQARDKARKRNEKLRPHLNNGYRIYGYTITKK